MTRLPLPEWTRPRSLPSLEGDEVHLWRVRLQASSRMLPGLERGLSGEEQARAARFQSETARAAFLAGRGVIRRLLGSHLGLAPEAVPISLSIYGKPACVSSGSNISFSLSHSGDLLLVAMGRGRAMGVDVEYLGPSGPVLQLARRFLAAEEAGAIASRRGKGRQRLFFEIWVRKEAFLKALGLGLSIPLQSFTVPLACNPPVLHDPGLEGHRGNMVFYGFSPFPGYVSALATAPPVPRIRLLDWHRPQNGTGSDALYFGE